MSVAEKAAAGGRRATTGRAAWIMTVMDEGRCVLLPRLALVRCPIPTEVRWGKESLPSDPAGRRRTEQVTGERQSGSLTDRVERRLRRRHRFAMTALQNEQWRGCGFRKSPPHLGGEASPEPVSSCPVEDGVIGFFSTWNAEGELLFIVSHGGKWTLFLEILIS